jgi:hypothetical protein
LRKNLRLREAEELIFPKEKKEDELKRVEQFVKVKM